MVLFKDINKSSTDLLVRDFVHDRPWEVEFKHQAKNPVFVQSAFINGGGVFDALSSAKYMCQCGSVEAKMGTSSSVLDAQYKAPFVPGLTFGSRFDRKLHSKGTQDAVELSADYLAANGTHCRLSINPLMPSWTASTVACIPTKSSGTASIGAEVTGSTDLRGVKYALGGSFIQSTKDLTYNTSFRTAPANGSAIGKLTTNIHAKANKAGSSEYGAEISHTIADSKTNVAFVGMWFIDQPTAGPATTYLKAKMSQDAQLATSLTHKFSDSLAGTIGVQIDASKGAASPDAVKYGFKLNLIA